MSLGVLNRLSWLTITTLEELTNSGQHIQYSWALLWYLHVNSFHTHNGIHIISISQPLQKKKIWGIVRLAQVHTAGKWQIRVSNPSSLIPEMSLFLLVLVSWFWLYQDKRSSSVSFRPSVLLRDLGNKSCWWPLYPNLGSRNFPRQFFNSVETKISN